MTETPVTYAASEGVAWITLDRPQVLNALDTTLAATLADHVDRAAADPEITLVIVRGAGRAFCSGMDRTALAAGTIGEAFYRHWIRALNQLEDMPKITLGVLHGYSIGGGLQLAVACEARIIGLGRAKELTLLNDHVTAEEARAIGLVNWVCAPDGVEAALRDIIEKVRQAAPTASAHAKRLLHASFHGDPRTLIEEVMRAQNDCMASWEVDEANRAWQEKREAVFHPRQR